MRVDCSAALLQAGAVAVHVQVMWVPRGSPKVPLTQGATDHVYDTWQHHCRGSYPRRAQMRDFKQ
jgi:hypothetical protein